MFNGPINITKEQWMKILKDENFITEEDYELLKLVYYSKDCKATSSDLAKELKKSHHGPINKQVGLLGEKVAKNLNPIVFGDRLQERSVYRQHR